MNASTTKRWGFAGLLAGATVSAMVGTLILLTPTTAPAIDTAHSSVWVTPVGSKLTLAAAALDNTVKLPLPALLISTTGALPASVTLAGNQLMFLPLEEGTVTAEVTLRDAVTEKVTAVTVRFTATPSDAPEPVSPAPAAEQVTAGRFIVNAVNLDTELRSMTPKNGVVDPPTFDHAYLVVGPGFATLNETRGTTVIAIHSGRGSTPAAGNALVDRVRATSTLSSGDILTVDGVEFIVRKTVVSEKTALPADVMSGQYSLVVVTCQQFADGRPSKNLLIYADRI